jgi:hypothetical protein
VHVPCWNDAVVLKDYCVRSQRNVNMLCTLAMSTLYEEREYASCYDHVHTQCSMRCPLCMRNVNMPLCMRLFPQYLLTNPANQTKWISNVFNLKVYKLFVINKVPSPGINKIKKIAKISWFGNTCIYKDFQIGNFRIFLHLVTFLPACRSLQ